ncbi:aldo/keto reductase [Roseofilum sp. BLCC_M154]|uniref:Aldo/keto reductase n=1 Tax=Roseofilum acuticapitatum BLCC-M154 TaxID=3022444 RepID=A0ABT7AVW4_9CYAN|nr:aldo/keto reductase [Roseofilum acuticapitatum]MDJ1171059.1 aldo/keto reductase [Roseofilum acuticapitatum BLCC-M154]
MQTYPLGNTDIQITPIIMGTWQADKSMWFGTDEEELMQGLRAGFEAGITTVDTASEYGEGDSERLVGRALRDVRDRMVFATKLWVSDFRYDAAIAACEQSLKNLQTDYIDLYQLHWPSGSWGSEIVPIAETMQAMVDLKQQGKIRAIGVSNFSIDQMEEARQYGPIDSLQPPYSLFWRSIEGEIKTYCIEQNWSILAYSPLCQGLLTGKFGPDHQFLPGDHRAKNKLFVNRDHYQRVQNALEQLRPIAAEKECTLAQLALAWVMAGPRTHAIAGFRNIQQVQDNAKAAEIKLSEEDLEKISAIGSTVTDHIQYHPVLWDF